MDNNEETMGPEPDPNAKDGGFHPDTTPRTPWTPAWRPPDVTGPWPRLDVTVVESMDGADWTTVAGTDCDPGPEESGSAPVDTE